MPVLPPPDQGEGIEAKRRRAAYGESGVGVPHQGCQALEVQEKFHIALRLQPGFNILFQGQKFRFRRVGEGIWVVFHQHGLVEELQVLPPPLRLGFLRLCRQGDGAQHRRRQQ